jgi:hypothetical protein
MPAVCPAALLLRVLLWPPPPQTHWRDKERECKLMDETIMPHEQGSGVTITASRCLMNGREVKVRHARCPPEQADAAWGHGSATAHTGCVMQVVQQHANIFIKVDNM